MRALGHSRERAVALHGRWNGQTLVLKFQAEDEVFLGPGTKHWWEFKFSIHGLSTTHLVSFPRTKHS